MFRCHCHHFTWLFSHSGCLAKGSKTVYFITHPHFPLFPASDFLSLAHQAWCVSFQSICISQCFTAVKKKHDVGYGWRKISLAQSFVGSQALAQFWTERACLAVRGQLCSEHCTNSKPGGDRFRIVQQSFLENQPELHESYLNPFQGYAPNWPNDFSLGPIPNVAIL